MTKAKDEALLAEMMEVFINTILYMRKAYPAAIFEKRKMYSTFVYVSVYPPLNQYISDVLKSAVCLIKVKKLRKVEVLFSTEDGSATLEKFIFELINLRSIVNANDNEYAQLTEVEERLRSLLLTLDTKCKNLKQLPDRFGFKINLHTTQSGFVKLTDNVKLQDFPWIKLEEEAPTSDLVLPLLELSGMQLYAESYV